MLDSTVISDIFRSARDLRRLGALLLAATLALSPAWPAGAETVKTSATPSGRVIGFIVPIDDGIISLTAIAKQSRSWALAALTSDGEVFWCFGIAGRDRTLRCDFQVQAFADIALVAVSASGTVKFDLNIDGPSDEPVLRQASSRSSVDTGRAVEAARLALQHQLRQQQD